MEALREMRRVPRQSDPAGQGAMEELPVSLPRRTVARWVDAVRAWPIWDLPSWLAALVTFVIVVDAVAIVAGLATFHPEAHDLILFALLAACVAITVELMRQVGEKLGGLVKDVYGAWALPD